MRSSVKRLALSGALATTFGIAAPVAGASEASTPVDPGVVASGQLIGSAVTGAIIITTAPTSFINTNNQISPVGNVSVGQVGP
jgi:hypothetical protein